MKMIKLSMVCGREQVPVDAHTGEDDDLDVVERELTKPVALDAEQVRNFYPRRDALVGTRILFRNGSALAVAELFDDVEEKIRVACS